MLDLETQPSTPVDLPVDSGRPAAVRRYRGNVPGAIGGLVWLAIVIVPIYFIVVTSFRRQAGFFAGNPLALPSDPTLDNYARFFEYQRIDRFFLNSAYVAIAVTFLQLLISSQAAYAFAKRSFPGRDALFLLTLGTMMIPGQVTLIPTYIILKHVPFFGGNNFLGQGGHGFSQETRARRREGRIVAREWSWCCRCSFLRGDQGCRTPVH